MKFVRKYPAIRAGQRADERIYRSETWQPCTICGEITDWMDTRLGLPVCSETCEYTAATRPPDRKGRRMTWLRSAAEARTAAGPSLDAVSRWPRCRASLPRRSRELLARASRGKRVIRAAKVRYRPPEQLRHTFASTQLSRNAPLLYVQKQGGWRSASVLLRVYARWMPQEYGEATGQPSAAPAQPAGSVAETLRLATAS